MSLGPNKKLRMLHRCWRYRFKSEVHSIQYVLGGAFAGTTVLDIGANHGIYSIYMSRAAGPSGKLIAFEAQPELGDHLADVRQSFALDNMTIVNKGLSSRPGVLQMRRSGIGAGTASFHAGEGEGWEKIDIPVIRLDDYVDEHGVEDVRFVKCDVEGHELEVFKGGERLLKRDHPSILFECHESEAAKGELFDYLSGIGYDGYFYHVTPEDHRSLLRKGRGFYVPAAEFSDYEYARPGVQHRNYVFVKAGTQP